MLFDEYFERLVATPALKDEDSIKKSDRRSAARIDLESDGDESIGSPLFEADGLSRGCRVARKDLIDLCYQVPK